ncbi:Lrp/AsnC family transcriptional regulator [Fictibacillus sp. S7]|uniref:Lrp/AsnC family transcriptional regulator n=1 Tax=Fictibacillus sp. S7 TaxID=2212476 RepID=UPI0010135572|nr:Lrp/AsnC family transcriptional regulator [Fictibacillus sp. S7]RXZ01508.1 hypothetical protein DMO16_18685 [Fictibacillus sp. S7]
MVPGKITNFKTLSEFQTVKEFNESNKHFLEEHGEKFTKGELIAFHQLTRYSVKVIGVCNARISTLVSACHEKGGISRSTVERMLRKARKLGIISIHHTIRNKGGYSHNIFVFHHFDRPIPQQLTGRQSPQPPCSSGKNPDISISETKNLETKNIKKLKTKTIRKQPAFSPTSLDYSYLPDYIPMDFISAVKPFFTTAAEICSLWQKARLAYNKLQMERPLEVLVPDVIQAFKITVYQYKLRKIKSTFAQYFYGVLYGVLTVERRRERYAEVHTYDWLNADESAL